MGLSPSIPFPYKNSSPEQRRGHLETTLSKPVSSPYCKGLKDGERCHFKSKKKPSHYKNDS
jgi:hypothetical protein